MSHAEGRASLRQEALGFQKSMWFPRNHHAQRRWLQNVRCLLFLFVYLSDKERSPSDTGSCSTTHLLFPGGVRAPAAAPWAQTHIRTTLSTPGVWQGGSSNDPEVPGSASWGSRLSAHHTPYARADPAPCSYTWEGSRSGPSTGSQPPVPVNRMEFQDPGFRLTQTWLCRSLGSEV